MDENKKRKGFGKEDIAIVIMVVAVALAVYMFNSGNGGEASDYEPSDFCLEIVSGAESNLSTKYTGVDCECLPPEPYRNDTSISEKVRNVTYIDDVVSCSANELEEDLIFPIMTINESKLESSGLNRSEIEEETGALSPN